jgi:hypothetical protein
MPRRTIHTTTRRTTTISDDNLTADEVQQLRRRTGANQLASGTGQQRGLETYHRHGTITSDTYSDSSESDFTEDSKPRATDIPALHGREFSSFPTLQRLQLYLQSTTIQSEYKTPTARPDLLPKKPTSAIHSTLFQPRATSRVNTRINSKQRTIIGINSDSDDAGLVSTVRTARRESITSSFARMKTRPSNSPKQGPLPTVQPAAQSKDRYKKEDVQGLDLTRTALEMRINSLRTSFTEKQRLALHAIVLGSQPNDAYPTIIDARDVISKTPTNISRERRSDGDNKSVPLLASPRANVADSSSTSTDSYSGYDSSSGTPIICEPSEGAPVDLSRKRVFSAGIEPHNVLRSPSQFREEPTAPSQHSQRASDLNRVIVIYVRVMDRVHHT